MMAVDSCGFRSLAEFPRGGPDELFSVLGIGRYAVLNDIADLRMDMCLVVFWLKSTREKFTKFISKLRSFSELFGKFVWNNRTQTLYVTIVTNLVSYLCPKKTEKEMHFRKAWFLKSIINDNL